MGLRSSDVCTRRARHLVSSAIRRFPRVADHQFWTDRSDRLQRHERLCRRDHPEDHRRCVAMITDPGDLVLDPTCGSGTAAYVREMLGRRWITVDTSRVALALARERLLTATYDVLRAGRQGARSRRGLHLRTLHRVTATTLGRGGARTDSRSTTSRACSTTRSGSPDLSLSRRSRGTRTTRSTDRSRRWLRGGRGRPRLGPARCFAHDGHPA